MQPRVTLCSVCHAQMPVGQALCRNCGSMLCPQCREVLPQRSRFCPKCGFLCVAEQQVVTSLVPSTPGRAQAMPIPRPATPIPQAAPQVPFGQTPTVMPAAPQNRNCPKCGSPIDFEQGRCTGCGLLYGIRHRAVQPSVPMPPAPMPYAQASWPQGTVPQQPHFSPAPQYGGQGFGAPPPPPAYHSGYAQAGTMPLPGQLIPIPRIAPNIAGTMPSGNMPSHALVPARPYQQQPPPPTKRKSGAPPSKGGLSGFAVAMIVVVALCLVGGGVYYFANQETPLIPEPGTYATTGPSDNQVSSSTLKILDVSIQSTTENSATVKWITDKPATGRIVVRDAADHQITTAQVDSLVEKQLVTVRELQPGTKYYYTVTATDANGTEATLDGELVTSAVADSNLPVISGINSNVSESTAVITWLTDEPATSQVKYFVSDNTSSSVSSTTPEETRLDINHIVSLSNLSSGTTYSFTIISKDASGNVANSESQTFTTVAEIPFAAEIGSRAPDFTLDNLSRQEIQLSDFKGKIVLLNFWAVWCQPCQEELPYIQSVSDNRSGNLVVLAIASSKDETFDTVTQFIQDQGYTFRVLYDSGEEVKSLYNIDTWPTTYFIDSKGIIQKIQVGSFENQAEIENMLSTMQ